MNSSLKLDKLCTFILTIGAYYLYIAFFAPSFEILAYSLEVSSLKMGEESESINSDNTKIIDGIFDKTSGYFKESIKTIEDLIEKFGKEISYTTTKFTDFFKTIVESIKKNFNLTDKPLEEIKNQVKEIMDKINTT